MNHIRSEPIIDLPDNRGACVAVRDSENQPGLLWADPSDYDGAPYFVHFPAHGLDTQIDGMPPGDSERALYDRMALTLRNALAKDGGFDGLPTMAEARTALDEHLITVQAARADAAAKYEIVREEAQEKAGWSKLLAVVATGLGTDQARIELLSDSEIADRLDGLSATDPDRAVLSAADDALRHAQIQSLAGEHASALYPTAAAANARLRQRLAMDAFGAAEGAVAGLRVVSENPQAPQGSGKAQRKAPKHLSLVR